MIRRGRGVLDAPVKPGHDSVLFGAAYFFFFGAAFDDPDSACGSKPT
jgi:hypothetical protein